MKAGMYHFNLSVTEKLSQKAVVVGAGAKLSYVTFPIEPCGHLRCLPQLSRLLHKIKGIQH
jgi:hypothetical protein